MSATTASVLTTVFLALTSAIGWWIRRVVTNRDESAAAKAKALVDQAAQYPALQEIASVQMRYVIEEYRKQILECQAGRQASDAEVDRLKETNMRLQRQLDRKQP